MVSVVFANLVSYRIFGRSLFDVQLSKRGFDLSLGRSNAVLLGRKVSELIQDDYLSFKPDDMISVVLQKLGQSGRAEGLVANKDGTYLGVIRAQDCFTQKSSMPIRSLIDKNAINFNETTSIWKAMEQLRTFIGEATPVVSTSNGKLLGVVTESALIAAYLDTVNRLRQEENETI